MSEASYVNRAGVPMHYGTGAKSNVLYCDRKLGRAAIPGSNGVCGPNNGPQCADCKAGPVEIDADEVEEEEYEEVARNRAGVAMHFGDSNHSSTYYCARRLGRAAIPGSNGVCGPNNGPQCADCKAGPVSFGDDEGGLTQSSLDGEWTVSYPETESATNVSISVDEGKFSVGSTHYTVNFSSGTPVITWADGTKQTATSEDISDDSDTVEWETNNDKYPTIVWTRA